MGAAQHLRPWKPGQSGNPGGRTAVPPELRAIKSLTQLEVCKLVSKYGRMKPEEIDALIEARCLAMVDHAIAKIFQEAGKRGDFQRLGFLLDRAIGKVPVVDPTDEESAALHEIASLSDEELRKQVQERLAAVPAVP